MRIAACGKGAAVIARLLCAGVWLLGCAGTEAYQLGQSIEMGPYSFEVVGADEGRWASVPTVNITFRLNRDDTLPFTTDFRMSFAYRMELVDAAGNAFPVAPAPVSPVYEAGRERSDRYLAEVRLDPSHEGVRDGARIGQTAADFKLIIDNPDRQADQPRRVAIQLQ